MRYLLNVTYNGKNYCGFQKQKNGNSIQQELESAIGTYLHDSVSCVASGRTDAKVSAYNQPVHFETNKTFYIPSFISGVNAILPNDIKVFNMQQTSIHARFSAKRKTYVYKMYISQTELPLCNDAFQLTPMLRFSNQQKYNFKLMKKFCKLIVGTHDFKGFQASGSEKESTVRTIFSAKLKKEGQYFNFYVTGNGFLYKMVRNLVGTMLELGKGRINFKQLKQDIFSTYKCTHTAKPEYLYLYDVNYK